MYLFGPAVGGVTSLDEFNTLQLTVDFLPKSSNLTDFSIDDVSEEVIKLFVHAPKNGAYASNKTAFLTHRSRNAVTSILENERIDGVVLHYGSNGKENLEKFFDKLSDEDSRKILMENSAGQGNSLGVTFDDLRRFHEKYESGLCVDTQHAFASGLIDFSKQDCLEKLDMLREIHKIDLIHLNDSKVQYGSRKDSHEGIREGRIWMKHRTPLIMLLNYMKEYSIPFVTETPDSIGDCVYVRDRLIPRYCC